METICRWDLITDIERQESVQIGNHKVHDVRFHSFVPMASPAEAGVRWVRCLGAGRHTSPLRQSLQEQQRALTHHGAILHGTEQQKQQCQAPRTAAEDCEPDAWDKVVHDTCVLIAIRLQHQKLACCMKMG